MESALDSLKLYKHNSQAIFGSKSRKEVKRVTRDVLSSDERDDVEVHIRTVTQRPPSADNTGGSDTRLTKLESQMDLMLSKLDTSPATPQRRGRSPSPASGCFRCGGDHFRRDCPLNVSGYQNQSGYRNQYATPPRNNYQNQYGTSPIQYAMPNQPQFPTTQPPGSPSLNYQNTQMVPQSLGYPPLVPYQQNVDSKPQGMNQAPQSSPQTVQRLPQPLETRPQFQTRIPGVNPQSQEHPGNARNPQYTPQLNRSTGSQGGSQAPAPNNPYPGQAQSPRRPNTRSRTIANVVSESESREPRPTSSLNSNGST
jgi:hypothetical protein